jgi:hypothetical protein
MTMPVQPHLRVILILGWFVPRARRGEWRREWEGELAYFEARLRRRSPGADVRWQLFARALGAWGDALHLNFNSRMVGGRCVAPLYNAIWFATTFPWYYWLGRLSVSWQWRDEIVLVLAFGGGFAFERWVLRPLLDIRGPRMRRS